MTNWTVGAVTLKFTKQSKPSDLVVAGWVNGPFALDYRTFGDDTGDYCLPGFVLTHIPTGYIVRQLVGVGTGRAQELADKILEGADWSFTGNKMPKECKFAVKAVMDKHPDLVSTGLRQLGPEA